MVYAKHPIEKVKYRVQTKKFLDVTTDRRAKKERRNDSERRNQTSAVAVDRRKLQRREKVSRRRQIDPTTCEREYTDEEIEFMHALDRYKRASGRMFPTCSEVLEVIRGLGYQRATPSSDATATISDSMLSIGQ